MQELEFRFTLDETNLLLESLGHLPYMKVYALVTKIQGQASAQLQARGPEPRAAVMSPEGEPATN